MAQIKFAKMPHFILDFPKQNYVRMLGGKTLGCHFDELQSILEDDQPMGHILSYENSEDN